MALLTRAVQAAARDAAREGEAPPPAWLALRPLHEWAQAAADVARLADQAERLSLDRVQAVLEAMRVLRGA